MNLGGTHVNPEWCPSGADLLSEGGWGVILTCPCRREG